MTNIYLNQNAMKYKIIIDMIEFKKLSKKSIIIINSFSEEREEIILNLYHINEILK